MTLPLIPVRMLNEFVYCPRLGYMMWAQGEFEHNEFTVDGKLRHGRTDKGGGVLPESPTEDEKIHAKSVSLSSEKLGITAKIDVVEGEGNVVSPVDYKRGKRPHIAGGVHEPEKVQLCAQCLLLREHGYNCDKGFIYFLASRERAPVEFDHELLDRTLSAIQQFRSAVSKEEIPPSLEDSPKCPRCSLIGICLPDEIGFLSRSGKEPRPVIPHEEKGLPLYVQSPRAYVRKEGERLVIEVDRERIAEVRFGETSQIVLFGNATLTTPALHECFRREIPATFMSYGGWFLGHSTGTGHHNVETRTHQFRRSFDNDFCLTLARRLVAGKIANCRTLLRRNWRDDRSPDAVLRALKNDLKHAVRASLKQVAHLGRYLGQLVIRSLVAPASLKRACSTAEIDKRGGRYPEPRCSGLIEAE